MILSNLYAFTFLSILLGQEVKFPLINWSQLLLKSNHLFDSISVNNLSTSILIISAFSSCCNIIQLRFSKTYYIYILCINLIDLLLLFQFHYNPFKIPSLVSRYIILAINLTLIYNSLCFHLL